MLASLRKFLWVMGAALLLANSSVRAAGMSPDPTGIWYDPAQPGWGMSITQQGDTMFVVLFLYDQGHEPTWLVASNVIDTGQTVNFLVGEAFAGNLFRTTGPFFEVPSDVTPLAITPAGNIQLAYIGGTNNISLMYRVDGVTVTKTVQPQTWRSNVADLLGTFTGGVFLVAPSPPCAEPLAITPQFATFTVLQGSTPDTVKMTWGTGIDTLCTMTGAYTQQGQLGSLAGPLKCGPVPSPSTNVGTLTISAMSVGKFGFSGAALLQSPTCTHAGTAGGVKS
jgi:hypothetical protein